MQTVIVPFILKHRAYGCSIVRDIY